MLEEKDPQEKKMMKVQRKYLNFSQNGARLLNQEPSAVENHFFFWWDLYFFMPNNLVACVIE